MFYYLFAPIMMYNGVLIVAAIIPAVFLLVRTYRLDRLEAESPRLLGSLVVAGILSSLLALVEEKIASVILNAALAPTSVAYNIILYFVIVAGAEESSKYIFLRRKTWSNPEFNCQYDGVLYAVFVSLGFALWENISYVLMSGLPTAIVRAVTAIPGHACFGVFMGVFYGIAKRQDYRGRTAESRFYRVLSVLVPALLHGTYDYIATMQQKGSGWIFVIFVAVLFVISYRLVTQTAKQDRYING